MKIIFILLLTIVMYFLQAKLHIGSEEKKNRFAVAVIFGVLCCVKELFFMTPPVPSITPYGQILSPDKEEIIIENSGFSSIYYSLDSNIDPRDGQKYTGPILKDEFPELPFTIAARSILIIGPFCWESNRTEQSFRAPIPADGHTEGSISDESAQLIGENSGIDSTTVSNQKTVSYDTLPNGIVSGWGDDSGGRESHTINEINAGVLGDQIIFNTISDSVIGNEKNFVGARVNNGINAGVDNKWEGNLIEVKEDEVYYIRMYCHNNSPRGYETAAKGVSARFLIPSQTGKTIVVNGMFQSSNATPGVYWDSVVLTADQPFRLEYIPGSAKLENNGIGAGGITLSDGIANGEWTLLGYNGLDGIVPGCYKYASYLTIQVTPVFES